MLCMPYEGCPTCRHPARRYPDTLTTQHIQPRIEGFLVLAEVVRPACPTCLFAPWGVSSAGDWAYPRLNPLLPPLYRGHPHAPILRSGSIRPGGVLLSCQFLATRRASPLGLVLVFPWKRRCLDHSSSSGFSSGSLDNGWLEVSRRGRRNIPCLLTSLRILASACLDAPAPVLRQGESRV